ncbi:LysE family translocator [Chelativorans sp. M5D2P16]|uniref:LysE family translocator n=1 Tax=Chelativorans sp. M5D2P16 TaxID=3095678 RepID=UPI003A1012C0
MSALLAALPWLTSAIQIAGGAYLIYIGVTLLRASLSRETCSVGEHEPIIRGLERPAASFQRGLFVGLGNPKMAAFFLGLFAPPWRGTCQWPPVWPFCSARS